MLDGIAGSFSSSARSKLSIVACAGDSVMKTSVLPHQTMTSRSSLLSRLELPDVGDDLLGEILLVLALLDVRAVEPLHVALIEHGRPRPDLLELGPDLVEQRRLDDAGRARGGVAVVLEDVPAAEHEVVEAGERHDVADLRRAAFGPLARGGRCPSASASRSVWRVLCEWRARRQWSWC